MAAISAIIGGIAAAATIAGTAVSMKAAHDQKKAMKKSMTPAPTYNAEKETKKVANQEAEANKRRVMAETDTIKTSALGNTGTTELKKKTLLGG